MPWWRWGRQSPHVAGAEPPFSVDVANTDEEIFTRERLADLVRSNEEQLVVLRSNLERFPGRLPASHVFTRTGLDQWLRLKGTHPIDRERAVNLREITPLPASVRAQMLRNITARQNGAGPSTQPQDRNGATTSTHRNGNQNLNRAIAASLANQARPNGNMRRAITASSRNANRNLALAMAEQKELNLAMQRSLNNRERRRSNSNTNNDIPIAWRRRA